MILFDNVTKRYANQCEAISRLNLCLNAGEFVFLTGHSGAGKSTLLKLITLSEKPTSGTLYVDSKNLSKLPKSKIPYLRRDIGTISQSPRLLNDRTIFHNVAIPLIIAGFSYQDIRRRVHAALDKVNLLHKEKSMPQSLSTGEQQRIGIARAIVNKPKILLADEPTGNLDPALSLEIMRLFEQFNQVGVTLLIASHDLVLIAQLNHRIIALKNGQLV